MAQRALSLPIGGMRCAGYDAVITTAVKELPGVETVSADHRANKVKVRFDDALVSASTILVYIESKGNSYRVMDEKVSWLSRLKQVVVFLVLLALVDGFALWGQEADARLGYDVIFTVGLNTWFLKICVHFSKYCEQVHRMGCRHS